MMSHDEIVSLLKKHISAETGTPEKDIGEEESFYDLGLDSISAVFLLDKLEEELKVEMNPMFFWDFPTVRLLADHLKSLLPNE